MNARSLWSNILTVAGGLGMIVGSIDPMEGSLLILPGSGLLALGTYLGGARREAILCKMWAFILIAAGVGALWGLSAIGGFGGKSGHSNWWALLLLPWLAGWCMAIWGAGSPRWLLLLGVASGAWYMNMAFIVKGPIAIVCGAVGLLTGAGCIYQLLQALKSKRPAVGGETR